MAVVDSSAVESPFMGEKTAAIIVYANCLKYPGLRPAPLLPLPFVFSGGAVSVKTFRDYSSTTADGLGMSAGEELGIPANEGIPRFSLDFRERSSSSLIVWKGELEFVLSPWMENLNAGGKKRL